MIADTPAQPADPRLDDLAQMISAYNQVTEKLQHSHEALEAEVLRLREELASTNAQLQRSKRLSALGEMAAGIAHEIRNPLAAIQLYAGMALEDIRDADASASDASPGRAAGIGAPKVVADSTLVSASDSVRRISAAVDGLSGIVNDVLAFAGQSTPEPRAVLAIDVIGKAVEAHLPAIDAAGVSIVRRDLRSPGLFLHADPNLLHQALLNLVRNAVDAMQGQENARTLTLDAAADEAGIVLAVHDSGPGIGEQAIDRIFNPFFTTRGAGTGLGLAIVHRIVDAHGGAIRVFNDGGAVFEIVLPNRPQLAAGGRRSGEAASLPQELSRMADRRSKSLGAAR